MNLPPPTQNTVVLSVCLIILAGTLCYEHYQLSQLSNNLAATADKSSLDTLLTRLALAILAFKCLPDVRQAMQMLNTVSQTSKQTKHNGAWVYGSSSARFTIVEYADLECPYCKDYFPQLKAWVDQHPDVNLQWHNLPLPMHEPTASYEARWAECAGIERGNDAFWLAVELIYQRTRSNGAGTAGNPQIPGLEDRQHFIDNCASSNPAVRQTVVSQAHKAGLDGITATPTLVIKDKVSGRSIKLQGAPDGNVLLSAIDWLASTKDL